MFKRLLGSRSGKTIGDGITVSEKELGAGGFSKVYEGTLRDGTPCAVKIISKKVFKTAEDRRDMLAEVEMMRRLAGNTHVVNMFHSSEDKERFFIVLELATGGDVMGRIEKMLENHEHFSEKVASRYFQQMLLGVKHCHDNLIVHRDLKPENFLLASDKADATVKLTDFGLSSQLKTPEEILTEACGSAYYIAPEIFTHKYGIAVDSFALGVILFIMLSGNVPFGGGAADENEIFRAIRTKPLVFGPEWTTITSAAKELISGLLEKDPRKRYTVEQALAHPWVAGGAASDRPIDRAVVDSIMAFNARNKFRKMATDMVASTLTAEDVATLRAAFMRIDRDNSGSITLTEMVSALRELGVAEKDASHFRKLVEAMDHDKDGTISWHEFLNATLEAQMVKHQQKIWEAFCKLDADGSGKITAEELRTVMKDEPMEQINKYIEEYDIDKDGTIDYEEFLRMMLPKNLKFRVARAEEVKSGAGA